MVMSCIACQIEKSSGGKQKFFYGILYVWPTQLEEIFILYGFHYRRILERSCGLAQRILLLLTTGLPILRNDNIRGSSRIFSTVFAHVACSSPLPSLYNMVQFQCAMIIIPKNAHWKFQEVLLISIHLENWTRVVNHPYSS